MIDLTRRECELIAPLSAAGRAVLEREEIYQRVGGYTMGQGDRSLDAFVHTDCSRPRRNCPTSIRISVPATGSRLAVPRRDALPGAAKDAGHDAVRAVEGPIGGCRRGQHSCRVDR